MISHEPREFDRNDPKYKCCCGCMHVITGSFVLASLPLIGSVIIIIKTAVYMENGFAELGAFNVFSIIISGIVWASMYYGLSKDRPRFLLPCLAVYALVMMATVLAAIVCFIGAVSGAQFAMNFVTFLIQQKAENQNTALFVFILILVALAFEAWLFWVVYKCYVFFCEQELYTFSNIQHEQQSDYEPLPIE